MNWPLFGGTESKSKIHPYVDVNSFEQICEKMPIFIKQGWNIKICGPFQLLEYQMVLVGGQI